MRSAHVVVGAGVIVIRLLAPETAAEAGQMPVREQNALIRTHCLPCHSDATPVGALSVEHLDIGRAPDSLAAMLLSQISQHLPR